MVSKCARKTHASKIHASTTRAPEVEGWGGEKRREREKEHFFFLAYLDIVGRDRGSYVVMEGIRIPRVVEDLHECVTLGIVERDAVEAVEDGLTSGRPSRVDGLSGEGAEI